MPKIRNVGNVKCITLHDGPAERPGFCGLVGNISWFNPSVREGLRVMFAVKPDEEIVAIEVTDDGIKAKFERIVQPIVRSSDGRRR